MHPAIQPVGRHHSEHAFYSIIPQKVRLVNKFMVELAEIREILILGRGGVGEQRIEPTGAG